MMRKWFLIAVPLLLSGLTLVLSACAAYRAASDTNDFLREEVRYTHDAQAVGRFRRANGIEAMPQTRQAEADAYDKLVEARAAGYSPESVADLKGANDKLESSMDDEGVQRDANRPVPPP